ncbi:hypothetical protein KP509_01G104400 [Ceratopteris richardii]|uniref:Trichome birefringence-like N-terminal domain-containing protein n=1 Tax=Ceratopteris richardii TaxID=49495 RepID=A0A8T2VPB7_CERRI|nr:hypothetical protein KP509_01G104400 [Ceratopteris richardii]
MAWEDSSRPSLRRFPIPFHTSCISTIHVCLLESQAEGGQQRHFSFSQSPRQMEQFHFLHRRSVGLLCMCIAFIAFSLFTLLAIFPFTPLQHHLPASWLQNSLSANPSFSDGYRNEREIFCPPPSMPFPDPLPDASVKEGSDAYGAELLLSSNGPSPVQSSLSPSSMPPSALSVGTQASSSSINSSLQRFAVIADPNSQSISSCDLSNGEWVLDGEHYPLYQPDSCPYVDESFNCQQNGRPDSKYLQWRWKPKGCALPRFDARSFLQKLRGKRMIFAGDSLMRNQWESMLCLLREGLNNKSHMFEMKGSRITKGKGDYVFKFPDYNARVEFYRSHFLVAEGKQRTSSSGKSRLTLRLDTIDKTSRKWLNADILIFTTGHWWNHGKTARGRVMSSITCCQSWRHLEGP